MTCSRTKNLIGPYIMGDTNPEECWMVINHTAQCPRCREDLDQRLAICDLLDSSVPELSKDEISRIKWYVKGAVSDCGKPHPTFTAKLVRAFTMVVFLTLGFAVGRWIGIAHNNASQIDAHAPLPVLTIKQEPKQTAVDKKENGNPLQNNALETASKSDASDSGTISPTAADYFRSLTSAARDVSSAGLATTRASRVYKRNRVIILDQPVPLDVEPDKNTSEDLPNANKLPVPSTLNNAETTQTQHGE